MTKGMKNTKGNVPNCSPKYFSIYVSGLLNPLRKRERDGDRRYSKVNNVHTLKKQRKKSLKKYKNKMFYLMLQMRKINT